ncbi:TPA_asm: P6 [Mango betacytorhabdovirus 1]|nr:TPA_asm: P6 [Mango betacytorhabdovirus 1]
MDPVVKYIVNSADLTLSNQSLSLLNHVLSHPYITLIIIVLCVWISSSIIALIIWKITFIIGVYHVMKHVLLLIKIKLSMLYRQSRLPPGTEIHLI